MTQSTSSTLGIDISNQKIDVAHHLPTGKWKHKAFSNKTEGVQKPTHWLDN